MRLAAQAKMGYYPTPELVTQIISQYLRRQTNGLIRILDPCTGEGTALEFIGNHLQAKTYGIELDMYRGKQAQQKLNHCLITDYQNTRISNSSFSLLWLNPPYDWAARNNELETSERYERTFLRSCFPYLCAGGILVYLISQQRLDKYIAQILSYRFEQLSVYKFQKEEYEVFKQLIIFGVLKKFPSKDDENTEYLISCGQFQTEVPYISTTPSIIYEVPISPTKASLIFSSKDIDPATLAEEVQTYGLFSQLKELTTPVSMNEKIHPIMPLRYGHLAQILACGFMNGVVWDQNQENPLLVKGVTTKETIHEVEVQGDIEKHIETDQIKIMIQAFNLDGEMLTIQ